MTDASAVVDTRERPRVAVPGRWRELLALLFPASQEHHLPGAGPARPWKALIQLAVVTAGAAVLLLRVPGVPPWDSLYAEDYWMFLMQALQHPWHLLTPYGGYEQLVPRIVGQVAALVPLSQAPRVFAFSGALIASGCALFLYHASAGHIRSRWLRALLGAALVLLPVAPLEIIDSAVDCPWYILAVLPWAILWRPRTRAGAFAAGLLAFAATSSEVLCAVLVPLLVLRVIALPRVREHAVTIGFSAGLLLQVPIMIDAERLGQHRITHLSTVPSLLTYYAHTVILRVPGWRVSRGLEHAVGINWATAIVAVILAALLGWACARLGRQFRVFTAVALLTGLAENLTAGTINSSAMVPHPSFGPETASRYSVLPILLIQAALIVAVDVLVRQRTVAPSAGVAGPAGAHAGGQRRDWRVRAVVAVLVAGLAVGWVSDFRYVTIRSLPSWYPTAAHWVAECKAGAVTLTVPGERGVPTPVPCANIRP
jgi:hypothetical protein